MLLARAVAVSEACYQAPISSKKKQTNIKQTKKTVFTNELVSRWGGSGRLGSRWVSLRPQGCVQERELRLLKLGGRVPCLGEVPWLQGGCLGCGKGRRESDGKKTMEEEEKWGGLGGGGGGRRSGGVLASCCY